MGKLAGNIMIAAGCVVALAVMINGSNQVSNRAEATAAKRDSVQLNDKGQAITVSCLQGNHRATYQQELEFIYQGSESYIDAYGKTPDQFFKDKQALGYSCAYDTAAAWKEVSLASLKVKLAVRGMMTLDDAIAYVKGN